MTTYRRKFRVQYGQPGHENEYCINIEGHSLADKEYVPIPHSYCAIILDRIPEIPDNCVMNRGTRIEVYVPEDVNVTENIIEALEGVGLEHDPEGWW